MCTFSKIPNLIVACGCQNLLTFSMIILKIFLNNYFACVIISKKNTDWPCNCCDTHARPSRATVWRPELPELPDPLPFLAELSALNGKGGTTVWTEAEGQTAGRLRAGAQRMCNVPVCPSTGEKATAGPLLVTTNRVIPGVQRIATESVASGCPDNALLATFRTKTKVSRGWLSSLAINTRFPEW